MHMLFTCLLGVALCGLISLAAPHYAPAAETLTICQTLIGVFACWIMVHEKP